MASILGVGMYLSYRTGFLQISRYIAVSKDCIQRITGRSLILQDGTELSISEKYLATARKEHTEYLHTKKMASV